MNKFICRSIIAGLAMIFFSFAGCSSNDEDMPREVTLVKEIEVPTSGTSNPIVPGQMIAVYGKGFTGSSEIWFHSSVKTKADNPVEFKAEIISVSDNGISFIAPKVSGQCDILLKLDGKTQTLGSAYIEEKNLDQLKEYTYVIGGIEDSPSVYQYIQGNDELQKKSDLKKGDVIKFALPGTNGNGKVYYFQRIDSSDKVSLCSYDLKINEEQVICSNWLNKFANDAAGQSIGMIEGGLCGVECSWEKGFEIIQFGKNGKNTIIKTYPTTQLVAGKQVVKFYCEDDNLLFNYDAETKCVLVTGSIQFEGEEDTSECLISLNIRTGDIKMIRDRQSKIWFQTLNTGEQILLLETEENKTTIKQINASTLETVSTLGVSNRYIFNPVYLEQSNEICWTSSDYGSAYYIMKYDLNTQKENITSCSLSYIETLFSIKY